MNSFSRKTADIFVPDGLCFDNAASRITHLGIGAHQDDLEFMAFQGILECFHDSRKFFAGVVCTNGTGSSRTGAYEHCTDEEMRGIRRQEQNQAAQIGRYGLMVQLDHATADLKKSTRALADDLKTLLIATQPQIVYAHNPADKHDSHLCVLGATITALREIPKTQRPKALYGCEVWRGLDWVNDGEKVAFNVGGYDHLASALNGVFDSQIGGGKRYDLATMGRRRANATYSNPHQTDQVTELALALDLTPLIRDDSISIVDFTLGHIDRFHADVEKRLRTALDI